MASLLALIIFSFLLIHHATLIPLTQVAALVVAQEYYPKERDALLLLRDSVSSTANLHSNWTGPPCTGNRTRWAGIACFNNHVVHLVLESIDMAGSLPPTFLQDVVYLSKVSFRNNSITGPLPRLGSLVYLQFVFLSHNLFASSIPMEYAYTIPSLERMELQQNKLNGEIPPFDQPNLNVLNVSYNDLQGQIPQTPVLISMPPSAYQGNPHLCGKPLSRPCPVPYVAPSPSPTDIAPVVPSPSTAPSSSNSQQRRKLKLWEILVIAIGPSLVVPFISMLFLLWYRRRRHRPRKGGGDQDSGEDSVEWGGKNRTQSAENYSELEFYGKDVSLRFDIDELLRAPSEVMGNGQLGSTYRATMESGLVAAVKKLKYLNGVSKKVMIRHMQLLGGIKHENLIDVISFYYSREDKLVVCEFLPDSHSLFELLHEPTSSRQHLDWRTRLSIVKGIAKGMAHLHQVLPRSHKVPHANLKSSNVLVTFSDGEESLHTITKLSDFGFQPLLTNQKQLQRLAAGMAPEVSQGKKVAASKKTDVYCFGILVLEIVTGRNPAGDLSPAMDLSEWVRSEVGKDWSTDVLDVRIVGEKAWHGEMLKLAEIGLECTNYVPDQRPSIADVVTRIEGIKHEGVQN